MTAMSDDLESKIIGHLFRGAPYTAPVTWYVALFSGAPGEAGGGVELSGNGYARVAIANSAAQWDAITGADGTTKNTNVVTFPAVVTANWAQATDCAIMDAATAGNFAFYGSLATPKTAILGETPLSFAAGQISVQIDN